jgi:hypothetical protein
MVVDEMGRPLSGGPGHQILSRHHSMSHVFATRLNLAASMTNKAAMAKCLEKNQGVSASFLKNPKMTIPWYLY